MPKLVISDGADSTAFASAGTWSNSTFVSGATASGKTPVEAAAMADDMFGRYEARVAADPSQHAMDYVHSYLHVAKGE
jgi:pyruvate kinase